MHPAGKELRKEAGLPGKGSSIWIITPVLRGFHSVHHKILRYIIRFSSCRERIGEKIPITISGKS